MKDQISVVLASGIIKDKKGRCLFLRRSNRNKHFKKEWQLPEGKLEFGETSEDCLIREIKEETGLVVTKLKLNKVSFSKTSVEMKDYHLIRIIYDCEVNQGTIELSPDHDEYCWLTLKEAKLLTDKISGLKELLSE